MAIKSTKKTNAYPNYPKLMCNGGLVVLFIDRSIGTVVHAGSTNYPIGHVSKTWGSSNFIPYEGTMELSNV